MYELRPSTRLLKLLDDHEFLLDYLVNYHPKFKLLSSSVARQTFARFADLEKIASIAEINLEKFIKDLAKQIEMHTGEKVFVSLEEDLAKEAEKKAKLKEMLKRLHAGEKLEDLKKEYADFLDEVDPDEIVLLEDELIADGIDAEEIQELCDIHIELFKDSLQDSVDELNIPKGHPINNYIEENKILIDVSTEATELLRKTTEKNFSDRKKDLLVILEKLSQFERHYIRKENQLFPFLEKHGSYGPPQVMWGVHDEIRKGWKEARNALDTNDFAKFKKVMDTTIKAMVDMVFKEHSVLFPLAMSTLDEEEWKKVKEGDDEIGYVYIAPSIEIHTKPKESPKASKDLINFATGALTPEQVELIFSHIPIDVSYVDENDEVKYFNAPKERFFSRSPAVIGRKVQHCHPPKSVHIVEQILKAFKSGEKDEAEFWIQTRGRFLHIRYFAVRDHEGKYRGVLEVTQDVTEIRKLEGEKRLIDWD